MATCTLTGGRKETRVRNNLAGSKSVATRTTLAALLGPVIGRDDEVQPTLDLLDGS